MRQWSNASGAVATAVAAQGSPRPAAPSRAAPGLPRPIRVRQRVARAARLAERSAAQGSPSPQLQHLQAAVQTAACSAQTAKIGIDCHTPPAPPIGGSGFSGFQTSRDTQTPSHPPPWSASRPWAPRSSDRGTQRLLWRWTGAAHGFGHGGHGVGDVEAGRQQQQAASMQASGLKGARLCPHCTISPSSACRPAPLPRSVPTQGGGRPLPPLQHTPTPTAGCYCFRTPPHPNRSLRCSPP